MKSLIGIDEVGRGPWAGPLVATAVELGGSIDGLADSKKLSKTQRRVLVPQICKLSLQIGIGWVAPAEIDKLGLTKATGLAMQRAMGQIQHTGQPIVIDGHINYLPDVYPAKCVVKADQTIAAVSAASVIAKQARDTYMQNVSQLMPHYGFGSHVGYGTKAHLQALLEHGACWLHRRSFAPVAKLAV